MKKRLFLMVLFAMVLQQTELLAQDIELTGSGYEKKEVVTVEGATTSDLYVRAMEALSDWKGPDGKAEAGLDFHDKDAGVVNYKGKFSLGFKKTFLDAGWYRYADFAMKVRCKDGRAQVAVTVPTITAINNRTGQRSQQTVQVWLNAVRRSSGAKHERGVALMEDLKETADGLVSAMMERLKNGGSDDDF